MSPPAGLSDPPRDALEAMVSERCGRVSDLTGLVAALRDEKTGWRD